MVPRSAWLVLSAFLFVLVGTASLTLAATFGHDSDGGTTTAPFVLGNGDGLSLYRNTGQPADVWGSGQGNNGALNLEHYARDWHKYIGQMEASGPEWDVHIVAGYKVHASGSAPNNFGYRYGARAWCTADGDVLGWTGTEAVIDNTAAPGKTSFDGYTYTGNWHKFYGRRVQSGSLTIFTVGNYEIIETVAKADIEFYFESDARGEVVSTTTSNGTIEIHDNAQGGWGEWDGIVFAGDRGVVPHILKGVWAVE